MWPYHAQKIDINLLVFLAIGICSFAFVVFPVYRGRDSEPASIAYCRTSHRPEFFGIILYAKQRYKCGCVLHGNPKELCALYVSDSYGHISYWFILCRHGASIVVIANIVGHDIMVRHQETCSRG